MNEEYISVLTILPNIGPGYVGGSEIQALRLRDALRSYGIEMQILTWNPLNCEGETQPNHDFIVIFPKLPKWLKNRIWPRMQLRRVVVEPVSASKPQRTILGRCVGTLKTQIIYLTYFLGSLIRIFPVRSRISIILCPSIPVFFWVTLLGTILRKPVLLRESTQNGILLYNSRFERFFVMKRANFVSMSQQASAALVEQGANGRRCFQIPNGVQIPRDSYSIQQSGDDVVFVGNLYQHPAKGLDVLVRAWAEVVASRSSAHLHIFGEGSTSEWKDFVGNLSIAESITFHGARPFEEILETLRRSAIFVLPSRREGMSNALLEAMGLGVPVIASDISANRLLVEHEKSGLLVPAESIPSLVAAILRLLKDRRLAVELGTCARNSIRERYSMDYIASCYRDLFHKLLSDGQ